MLLFFENRVTRILNSNTQKCHFVTGSYVYFYTGVSPSWPHHGRCRRQPPALPNTHTFIPSFLHGGLPQPAPPWPLPLRAALQRYPMRTTARTLTPCSPAYDLIHTSPEFLPPIITNVSAPIAQYPDKQTLPSQCVSLFHSWFLLCLTCRRLNSFEQCLPKWQTGLYTRPYGRLSLPPSSNS